MEADESLIQAINEEVHLVAHDPLWAVEFAAERERLLSLFPNRLLAVEHIGSTAIPRLSAKPIIDILAAVNSMDEADALLVHLCSKGYETSVEFNATLEDRRWLMRHADGKRTHHLHLVVANGVQWKRHLRFRDLMRSDRVLLEAYEALKLDLAERFKGDREAYTNGKTAFIDQLLNAEA